MTVKRSTLADVSEATESFDQFPKPGEYDFGDSFIDENAGVIARVERELSPGERDMHLARALVICAGCTVELCADDCTNKMTRGVLEAAGASIKLLPIV